MLIAGSALVLETSDAPAPSDAEESGDAASASGVGPGDDRGARRVTRGGRRRTAESGEDEAPTDPTNPRGIPGTRNADGTITRPDGAIVDPETGFQVVAASQPPEVTQEDQLRDFGQVGAVDVPRHPPIGRLGNAPPWTESTSVYGVAFSPDGREALTGARDGLVKLWDVATGQIVRRYAGHTGWVTGVAFGPGGRRVASSSQDGTARIWDKQSGQVLLTLEGHTDSVESIAFSSDGTRCLTGAQDHSVRLWDSITGRELRVLKGHTDDVYDVAFSPDGTRALSGGRDTHARLWDLETGKTLHVLAEHGDFVKSVAFSPDGKQALTGSYDRTARLWDLETGEAMFLYRIGGSVEAVEFIPGLALGVVAGEGPGRVISLHRAEVTRELPQAHDDFTDLAVSPDGRIAIAGGYDGALIVWDLTTGDAIKPPQPENLLAHEAHVLCVDVTPDAGRAVSGDTDGIVKIWNLRTATASRTLTASKERVLCVEFSPDGTMVAAGDAAGRVTIWHTGSGGVVRTIDTESGVVYALAWRPDGNMLLTGHDPAVHVWNPHDGEKLRSFAGHSLLLERVVFRADGEQVATGARDRTLHLWNPETLAIDATISPKKGWLTAMAYVPKRDEIVVGIEESFLQHYETSGGEPTWSVRAHAWMAGIEQLLVTPNGKRVITASQDRIIGVFEAKTGKLLHTLRGHVEPITDLALAMDGTTLLSSSIDRNVFVWRLPD